ncbi:WhiB family transcriptional regulator [Nocardioides cynanchi]|uniref:WhiB family transcriptional regulator n=1 Tax=Nocardioides cynanchi TaxID=2558918 RepID=UPI0012469A55|nr:WhiB family transcriptional regulator [Nocardioides cynanchi]
MDWWSQASCLKEDPELFFPVGTRGPAVLQVEEARQVCRRCLVRTQCLEWAIASGPDHGVWGGLDAEERRQLKRSRAQVS